MYTTVEKKKAAPVLCGGAHTVAACDEFSRDERRVGALMSRT